MNEQSAPPTDPLRILGPIDATCVVVGAIIGVGIFFNPSRMAGLTGSDTLLMLAWAVGGLIALCGALTFAELGGAYHASGAQYQILRDTYGPLPAFVFVFCNATAIQAGVLGIIAMVCANHLGVAVNGVEPRGWGLMTISCALIISLAIANIVGVRWGAQIQNLTVLSKIITLLAITALAFFVTGPAPASTRPEPAGMGGMAGVLAALVPALFAFGGWQQALWISGEVRAPRRNLPRAIVIGVLIVIVVYLLANWAYLRLLGIDRVADSQTLASDAVAAVWPGLGRRVVAAAVAISAFGVLNAQLLSGPRLIFGMARDGRFFSAFATLSPRFGTPVAAIVMLGGMALALLLIAGFNGVDKLLTIAVQIDALFFALTGAALIILRRTKPALDRPFRVPGYPVVPALFVLGELGVIAGSFIDPAVRQAAYLGLLWLAAAALIYLVFFRSKPAGFDR